MRGLILVLLHLILTTGLSTVLFSPAAAQSKWSLTAYTATLVEIDMVQVPFNLSRINNHYRLGAVALARDLVDVGDLFGFEAEAQVAHYFQGNDHTEFNLLLTTRWKAFPWDRFLDTSFAFGAGLSFASATPYYENAHFKNTSPMLGYLLWEIDLFLPGVQRLGVVARLHHRSGAGGKFRGVYAGSNAVGFGLKYKF